MRTPEINSPVLRDADPYRAAHRELEAALVAKKRNWNGLDYDARNADVISWEETDSHRADAIAQLRRPSQLLPEGARQYWSEEIAAVRKEYLAKRDHARLTVRLADKAGEEVPDEIRELAEGPDRYEQYEAVREKMVADRRRTLQRMLAS